MRKYLSVIAVTLVLTFVFTSCSNKKADYVDEGTANIDFTNSGGSDTDSTKYGGLYGAYIYPDNPAEELRSYLENDIMERGLPLEIGDINSAKWDGEEREEFLINFKNNKNVCAVSFVVTYYEYGYPLSGSDNPSFTIAFKDPENSQDMITVLTSVIMYLSPDLGLQEAERLSIEQDDTLSIDGYSIPKDIGGYQIQSHYTNPHDYFTTKDFTAKFGVSVKALKQIWGGEIDMNQCQKLSTAVDFRVLDDPQSLVNDDRTTSRVVYADFTVKDWWEDQEPIHGDFTTFVTVESPYGEEYLLILDYMRMPYEFGIGEKYKLFINYHYGKAKILHALQLTQ